MPRKPLPRWDIAKAKAQWLGEVEAETAEEAIAKVAKEFGREASKLIATRRRKNRVLAGTIHSAGVWS